MRNTRTGAADAAVLAKLRELGCELVPVELPDYPVDAISFILSAEAAAAFDELTRSGRDDLMVRQTRDAWPNVFRASRLIPAVEYIQANRLRYLIIQDMQKLGVDVWLSPSFGGKQPAADESHGTPVRRAPERVRREREARRASHSWESSSARRSSSPSPRRTRTRPIFI